MRLERIKLAGFKSFVEPTAIPITGNLTGIVGPNGCGKSNIIDAVRWVMGESSAKQLRGDTMADVIFNGSVSRKSVGMASVELIFDNRGKRIGGEFASYDTISVKRQVSRDGQSLYLLNGSRCRRRDITDMFLGTGVGSRSYAIIEQGMISRLIEAKPEELRQFLEEAAGISKYKERRRETETRIRHTRENLDRLNDLRAEVTKQLNFLKRQSKKAERYKALKKEERQIKQELLAIRWRGQNEKYQADSQTIQLENNKLKTLLTEQQNSDAKQKTKHDEARIQQDRLNEIQGDYYAAGSDISRLEQSIKHAQADREAIGAEKNRLTEQNAQANLDVEHDTQQLEQIRSEVESVGSDLAEANIRKDEVVERQMDLHKRQKQWQSQWDNLKEDSAGVKEQAEIHRTRIDHLEQQHDQMQQRSERLIAEQESLKDKTLESEILRLEKRVSKLDAARQDKQAKLETSRQELDNSRQPFRETQDKLNQCRSDFQNNNGKIASLELLQQHTSGKDRKTIQRWLKKMDLEDSPRLVQHLKVEPHWEDAVELVLGTYLEAICLEDLDQVLDELDKIGDETVAILAVGDQSKKRIGSKSPELLDQVKSPWKLDTLLSGIYCAKNLKEAQALQASLNQDESVVTPDGQWLGSNWLMQKKSSGQKPGILKRENEMRALIERNRNLGEEIARLESEIEAFETKQRTMEEQIQELQRQLDGLNTERSDCNAELSGIIASNEGNLKRLEQLACELDEIDKQRKSTLNGTLEFNQLLEEAENKLKLLESQKHQLSEDGEELDDLLTQCNDLVTQAQRQVHELESRIKTLESTEALTRKHLSRAENQSNESTSRLVEIETKQRSLLPMDTETEKLKELKTTRSAIDKTMQEARAQLESIEQDVISLGESRIRTDHEMENQRELVERSRVDAQTALVRRQTVEEQLREMGQEVTNVVNGLPNDADEAVWKTKLEGIGQAIETLGAINLTAVDESQSLSERSDFLSRQDQDLTKSLETLERAIDKMDRESKARFKDTFDKINAGLQTKFPKLFGGGEARLALSGENLLESGVTIIARPPGKKTSSIHLLSGGEKALTAVALVFSLFELNPAPFCLLDEVDAPLDDNNVVRFSQLLRDMSGRTQFLFITHNKITMEIAECLTGVTMNEPGVSRMVAVDIDKAVEMAV